MSAGACTGQRLSVAGKGIGMVGEGKEMCITHNTSSPGCRATWHLNLALCLLAGGQASAPVGEWFPGSTGGRRGGAVEG